MRVVTNLLAAAGLAACGLAFAPTASADTLEPRHVRGMCLDLSDYEAVIARCDGSDGQDFRLPRRGSGRIETDRGTCLTVDSQGDALIADRCRRNSSDQRWSLVRGRLQSDSGLCADVDRAGRRDGTPVIAWRCHGGDNQSWSVRGGRDDNDDYGGGGGGRETEGSIRSVEAPGKCLNVDRGRNRLTINECRGRSDERFAASTSGRTNIRASGGCVTSPEGSGAYYIAECGRSRAQQFTFQRDGSIQDSSGRCMSLNYGDKKNNTLVIAYRCSNPPSFRWQFGR